MSSVETKALLKTTLILVIFLLIASGLGYFVYNYFQEEPLDTPPPFVAEVKDADIQFVDEEKEAQVFLSLCSATSDTEEARDMLARVNAYRAQNGLGPLKLSPTLMKAAAWFADDLLASNARGHIDSQGRNPSARATDCGYPSQIVVENSAGGIYADPLAYWQQSPGHNKNLLKPDHKVMGYGIAGIRGEYRYVYISGVVDDSAQQPMPSPSSSPTPKSLPSQSPTPINSITPTGTTATPSQAPSPQPTATTTPDPTPPDDPNSIVRVELTFPGIGPSGNADPVEKEKNITTELFNEENEKVSSREIKYTYENGIYVGELGFGHFDSLHRLRVKPHNALAKIAQPELFRIQAGTNVTLTAELILGDVTGDNILDVRDYNAFLATYQSCVSANSGNECREMNKNDFNSDGQLTGVDYNILLRSFQLVKGD